MAEKYGAEVVVLHVIDRANLDEGDERMAEVEHVASRERDTLPWVANVPAELAAMLTPRESAQTQEKMLGYLADKVVRAATRELEAHGVRDDRIRVVFKNGHAVKRILETVEEEQPDLVVTGSRGVSDLSGAFQGSVSHRVAHLAPCSVITVK
ncbi:MAG: universal stress protein [Halofilum sp. (in: g-proteobacteria)]|nr:universal stress protein [Halofilum sp. (in: g-proteobacteria)]